MTIMCYIPLHRGVNDLKSVRTDEKLDGTGVKIGCMEFITPVTEMLPFLFLHLRTSPQVSSPCLSALTCPLTQCSRAFFPLFFSSIPPTHMPLSITSLFPSTNLPPSSSSTLQNTSPLSSPLIPQHTWGPICSTTYFVLLSIILLSLSVCKSHTSVSSNFCFALKQKH